MGATAWDVLIDDETYQLLEEYFGRSIELQEALYYMDRGGVLRMLDCILNDDLAEEEDKERARKAKRLLS